MHSHTCINRHLKIKMAIWNHRADFHCTWMLCLMWSFVTQEMNNSWHQRSVPRDVSVAQMLTHVPWFFQATTPAVWDGNVQDVHQHVICHACWQHRDRRGAAHRAALSVLLDVVVRRTAGRQGHQGIQWPARNTLYSVSIDYSTVSWRRVSAIGHWRIKERDQVYLMMIVTSGFAISVCLMMIVTSVFAVSVCLMMIVTLFLLFQFAWWWWLWHLCLLFQFAWWWWLWHLFLLFQFAWWWSWHLFLLFQFAWWWSWHLLLWLLRWWVRWMGSMAVSGTRISLPGQSQSAGRSLCWYSRHGEFVHQ